MTVSDSDQAKVWIGWPASLASPGTWINRATDWFNDVARRVRFIRRDPDNGNYIYGAETDIVLDPNDSEVFVQRARLFIRPPNAYQADDSEFRFTDNGGDRLRMDWVSTSDNPHEIMAESVRAVLFDTTQWIHYMDDGATEIGQWNRDNGYLDLKRIRTDTGAALAAGVTNWPGTTYEPFTVYKDADGFIHLEGLIQNTSGAGIAAGATIATLSVGFRPAKQHVFFQAESGGGLRVDVTAAGAVVVQATWGSNNYLSLSGLSFFVGH